MAGRISSIDPRTGLAVEDVAAESTPADVARAVDAATAAGPWLEAIGIEGRAALLLRMADELESDRERLVALADRETALGPARLGAELTRTIYQLGFMAGVLRDGGYAEIIVDHAHDTPMGRLPDVRRMLRPIGPVAVFAASNFPFAFSVPGGDTAAALAAGCPVVVKVHHGHAATSEAVLLALLRACSAAGAPDGTLGRVYGREAGTALVTHPGIRAAAFTGSIAGGRALFDLAVGRPDPIPFFGELGSLNPLAVTPAAAAERGGEIGQGWVASFTLGAGQFCTKPGLALVPAGPAGEALRDAVVAKVQGLGPAWLLNRAIHTSYGSGLDTLAAVPGSVVHSGAAAPDAAGFSATATLVETTTARLAEHATPLLEECFGPAAVLARYEDEADLLEALARIEGSLTASVHVGEGETDLPARILRVVTERAGRVVVNGYPTGVGVTWAMHHGGPWPASTSSQHTSVGATGIRRFLRPVSFQDVPDALLPPELRDGNPLGLPRRVDGRMESGA
jgi:NADP-dependent aldehyde dehydrogenase